MVISNETTRQNLKDCMLVRSFGLLGEVGYTEAHFKCFYTNEWSKRNKQTELEALAQTQSYRNIGISKTWKEESCEQCKMDGYRLFRGMGAGGGGWGWEQTDG